MSSSERLTTLQVYEDSAIALAEYYSSIAPRDTDINRAFAALGKKNPVVVELGCGNGRDAALILEQTSHYLGIDFSQNMIELAQAANPTGEFQVGDITELALPQGVDIVFGFAAWLHSSADEVKDLFKRCHAALNPGGLVYLSLKEGKYSRILKEDSFGQRWFYLYEPADIERLAGERFSCEYLNHQAWDGNSWFTIMLRKR